MFRHMFLHDQWIEQISVRLFNIKMGEKTFRNILFLNDLGTNSFSELFKSDLEKLLLILEDKDTFDWKG